MYVRYETLLHNSIYLASSCQCLEIFGSVYCSTCTTVYFNIDKKIQYWLLFLPHIDKKTKFRLNILITVTFGIFYLILILPDLCTYTSDLLELYFETGSRMTGVSRFLVP